MPPSPRTKPVRSSLNVRIQPELRGLIDEAAVLSGKNRTDFILDAARFAAQETLLNRGIFAFKASAYDEFVKRLDAPANPNARLRRSLQTPPPWKT